MRPRTMIIGCDARDKRSPFARNKLSASGPRSWWDKKKIEKERKGEREGKGGKNAAGAHHYIDPWNKTRRWRPCLDRDGHHCSPGGRCRIFFLFWNNRDRMRTRRTSLTICRRPLKGNGRTWKSRLNLVLSEMYSRPRWNDYISLLYSVSGRMCLVFDRFVDGTGNKTVLSSRKGNSYTRHRTVYRCNCFVIGWCCLAYRDRKDCTRPSAWLDPDKLDPHSWPRDSCTFASSFVHLGRNGCCSPTIRTRKTTRRSLWERIQNGWNIIERIKYRSWREEWYDNVVIWSIWTLSLLITIGKTFFLKKEVILFKG